MHSFFSSNQTKRKTSSPKPKSILSTRRRKGSNSSGSKRSSNKTQKRVTISSPKNETRVYRLGKTEKKYKRSSPQKINYPPCGKGHFPCKINNTIFENEDEWNDFLAIQHSKNESTGYRSINRHKYSTLHSLAKQGKAAKKIPERYRLYSLESGEVFDMRELNNKLFQSKI